MQTFNPNQRSESLDQCVRTSFDIIVVGGGITGAGIFLEASQYGLKAGLFEQDDFASATSSASSKLIHGGLRYLEMMDFGLVFESCRERKRLLEMAPELVHPLRFLFPVYKKQRRILWTIYIGTWIYSLLAIFRNIGFPKKLSISKTLEQIPQLNRRGLNGAVQYFDASTLDCRLTLATIKTGQSLGGAAFNHTKVVEYIRANDKICGVVVEDTFTKKKYRIHAKWVINAIGPWTDKSKLRMTKGTHMIVHGNPFEIQTAVVMLSPIDGRVVFLLPWCGHTLVGTTDDDFEKNPDELKVEKEELDYLIRTIHAYFPTVKIPATDIMTTFAGLRCLQHEKMSKPSDISREHILFSDTPGLLTVAGGKLTTFLSMGEEIMSWIIKKTPDWKTLRSNRVSKIMKISPLPFSENLAQETFQHYIRYEMAMTIKDLLKFRTLSYYLSRDHGASLIEAAGQAIKTELGFSDEEILRQINEYKNEIKKQQLDVSQEKI